MEKSCKDHEAHVVRLRNLEDDMKDLKTIVQALEKKGINPGVYIGLFSFFGICFSTAGSLLGILLSAYIGK